MRVLLFGDGEWATRSLERLVQERDDLIGVVVRTKPTDSVLLHRARSVGLPVLQPPAVNSPDFVAHVRGLHPDLNLSISYDQIIRRPLLEVASLGFVNFHAGKLPFYRGRSVINWAIINGESEVGLTAHYMDEGVDTGDIILQRTLPIGWEDTYGDVLARVVAAMPSLVVGTLDLIQNGRVERRPQPLLLGTYYGARREGDEWLDWSDSSRDLYNKIRALAPPGPGARTVVEERPVIIWSASYDPAWPVYRATSGEVVGRCAGGGVLVKTGDSVLLVRQVQVGQQPAQVPTWPIGTRLGIDLPAYLQRLHKRIEQLEQAFLESRREAGGVRPHHPPAGH